MDHGDRIGEQRIGVTVHEQRALALFALHRQPRARKKAMKPCVKERLEIMGEQKVRLRRQHLRIPCQPDRVRTVEHKNRLWHLRIGSQPRTHVELLLHSGGHGPERSHGFRLAGRSVPIDIDTDP